MSSGFGKKCKKLFFEKPIVLQKVLFLLFEFAFQTNAFVNLFLLPIDEKGNGWASIYVFQSGKELIVGNGILWHSNGSVNFQPIFDIFW